jgi:uncharacterized protein (TIGR02597 family)
MNLPRFSRSALIALLSLPAFSASQAQEATATTEPVGYMTFNLPAGSDTRISTPLAKAPVFKGAVSSRSGFIIEFLNANLGSLTEKPHYLQVVNGDQAGMLFDISSNTSSSITLVDNGVTPNGLSEGTQVTVIEYWTVGSLFPAADRGVSFTASASTTAVARRTQILLPNNVSTGINRAVSTTLFFANDSETGFWRTSTQTTVNANDTPLLPDTFFIVRNPATAASNLKLTVTGSVITSPITIQIDRVAGGANDNYVSMSRPMDISLKNLGLVQSGAFLPSSATTAVARRDQLLVFDNNAVGINKAPAATYFYVGTPESGTWRSAANTAVDASETMIPAGSGIVVRKYGTGLSSSSQFWENEIVLAP